jgi:hypothetical protein
MRRRTASPATVPTASVRRARPPGIASRGLRTPTPRRPPHRGPRPSCRRHPHGHPARSQVRSAPVGSSSTSAAWRIVCPACSSVSARSSSRRRSRSGSAANPNRSACSLSPTRRSSPASSKQLSEQYMPSRRCRPRCPTERSNKYHPAGTCRPRATSEHRRQKNVRSLNSSPARVADNPPRRRPVGTPGSTPMLGSRKSGRDRRGSFIPATLDTLCPATPPPTRAQYFRTGPAGPSTWPSLFAVRR